MDFDDDLSSGQMGDAPAPAAAPPAFDTDDGFDFGSAPAPAPAPAAAVDFGGDDDFLGGGGSSAPAPAAAPAAAGGDDDLDFGGGGGGGESSQSGFEQHATPAASSAFDAGDDDFLGGGAGAPAPAAAPTPAAAAPSPAPAPAAATPASSTPRYGDEETPFTIWQKKHQQELQKKADESRAKHDEAKEKAAKWIQEFYQERALKFDKVQGINRDNEREALIGIEQGLVTGPSWERVCGLVDLQSKTDARDTSRMRQVLLQVKAHPPPHMLAAQ